jgi:hypothetical protein
MKDTQLARIPHKNTKYVIVSLYSGNALCDPMDFDAVRTEAEQHDANTIEIAEFIETWKPTIDYSVLDTY